MTKQQIIEAIQEARQEGCLSRSSLIYNDLTANLDYDDSDMLWKIIDDSDGFLEYQFNQTIDEIASKIYESKKETKPKNMKKDKYIVLYSSEDDPEWRAVLHENSSEPMLYSSLESANEGFNKFIDDMYNGGEINIDVEHAMHIFKLESTKNFKIKVPQVKLQFT